MNKVSDSTLVIIPTYNEVENLPIIVGRVREAQPDVDILIVDDNSPDGTGIKADELAASDDHIKVLHREGKGGLLGAYLAGFDWGLEREYAVICQMDADGSHAPEQLHLLLEQIDDGADLVIGSRYVPGGKVVNWPRDRYLLSKLGNLYIALVLTGDVRDMTAGYRAIRREVLQTLDPKSLSKKGYIFQVEFAFRAIQQDFDVREVPITFTERELGESKLDASFAKDSLVEVTKWGVTHRTDQFRDFASSMSKLITYEYKHSKLPGIPNRVREMADQASGMASEGLKLANYEVKHSGLPTVPNKVKGLLNQMTGMVSKGAKLADYEVRNATKKR
ncbi:polyprenol monophosphomannose synthase [Corynebacterium breve]|uniref:Polyprenol monophosphomannose synthase n=1 Tax=Corynebacterium breve TaxID=3049799 RepID=A0ABY8VIM6_9CORY|nr:polyprenol monophosphomannose synthase [Corynebacterium breve]WIM68826.1 polyprenol monophosphomannose synthase [Corynebacterium breve]